MASVLVSNVISSSHYYRADESVMLSLDLRDKFGNPTGETTGVFEDDLRWNASCLALCSHANVTTVSMTAAVVELSITELGRYNITLLLEGEVMGTVETIVVPGMHPPKKQLSL